MLRDARLSSIQVNAVITENSSIHCIYTFNVQKNSSKWLLVVYFLFICCKKA